MAVQAEESLAETEFLLQLSKTYSWINAVVGWIDLESADLDPALERFQQETKLKGFRKVLQHLAPEAMENPAFIKGISALGKFNYTYDILIYPQHLEKAFDLAKRFPYQKFVIDHLAKPDIKEVGFELWSKHISAFSTLENVSCKVSGMVTEADWTNWRPTDFRPYLEKTTETFGTDRLMFGSDWPVCLVAAEYEEVFDIAAVFFSSFSKIEQAKIFGKNASEFYGIK